jgi:hypothetical protein
MTDIQELILANDPESEVIRLSARLCMMQQEIDRLVSDRDSLPMGWAAVKINDNTIRINALDSDGNFCHWILSTDKDLQG